MSAAPASVIHATIATGCKQQEIEILTFESTVSRGVIFSRVPRYRDIRETRPHRSEDHGPNLKQPALQHLVHHCSKNHPNA